MVNNRIWAFILFFIGLFLMLSYIKSPIKDPNAWWWNDGSDPLKSYYLPAYYLKYDHGMTSTGFNYPYGEHAVFADIQPALVLPLNWFDDNIYPIHRHFNIIMLAFLFGSVLVGGLLMYKILFRLGLPAFWAGLGTIFIMWLSPQWERVPSHYGLAYMWLIPSAWYIIIRLEEGGKAWKWLGGLFGVTAFAGLLHMYNLLIIGIFVGAYSLISILGDWRKWKQKLAYILPPLAAIIFVQLLIKSTDPYGFDRPKQPWGFFAYMSEPEAVFLPQFGAMKDFLHHFFGYADVGMEGWSYIGLLGSLSFVFILLGIGQKLIRKETRGIAFQISEKVILSRSWWAAFFVLLFSMGVPFVWGFEFLLDWFPQIKQFRAMGRFTWPFYYVMTAFAIIQGYILFEKIKSKGLASLAVSLLVIAAVIWGMEGHINLRNRKQSYERATYRSGESEIDYAGILAEVGTNIKDFQAILFFPYSHMGSEKIGIHRSDISLQQAVYCSYKTGLPIISTFSSRTSQSQSLKSIQLLAHPALEKKILKDLPNQKPILLICSEETKQPEEQRIIDRSKLIRTFGRYSYYHVPLEAFKTDRDSLLEQFRSKENLKQLNGFYFDGNVTPSVVFDPLSSGKAFEGNYGRAAVKKSRKEYVLEVFDGKIPLDTAFAGKPYELGLWVRCDIEYPYLPLVYIETYNEQNALIDTKEIANFRNPMDIYRNWVLHENEIANVNHNYRYRLYLKFDCPFVAANFIIKPKDTKVFYESGGVPLFDFYPLGD